jgi:hypothetical protein
LDELGDGLSDDEAMKLANAVKREVRSSKKSREKK